MKKSSSKASVKAAASAASGSTIAPGHFGNLSIDQGLAVAELWMYLFHLFAQPPDTPVTSTKLPTASKADISPITSATGDDTGAPPPVADALAAPPVDAPVTVAEVRRELWLACQDLHPDTFLLRFLRARKFDVAKAYAMLVDCIKWRVISGVQDVVAQGEAAIDSKQFQGKAYFYKTDRVGRPVIYINARLHEKAGQTEAMLQRHTVYLMETARLVLPRDIETVTIVFNLTGFGMANMDNAMVSFLIKCLEARYPESLGVCLIVNAPWFFSGLWKLIRGWLDPVVAAKIEFVKDSELGQYIDPANIPAELAKDGKYMWSYPAPTPAEISAHRDNNLADTAAINTLLAERQVATDELERATRDWATLWLAQYKPAALVAAAGGSGVPHADEEVDVTGACDEAQRRRQELVDGPLRRTWWAYDDKVRFPSAWHRLGVIQRGGQGVDWSKLP